MSVFVCIAFQEQETDMESILMDTYVQFMPILLHFYTAKKLNERNVLNVLHDAKIADADWELIGAQLIDRTALRTIRANRPGEASLCMIDTISQWLKTDLQASWEKLAEAVERVAVCGEATAVAVRWNAGIGKTGC